jgi:phage terminase large subunit-like protein
VRRGEGGDVLAFVRAYGRITKDSVAGPSGAPLNPRYWQEQLIRQTFARTSDGRRRHRIAMWAMARKNGKTGIVAPVALFGLFNEGDGAEVYSCAADRDQAKLVFGAAKRIVEMVPDLMAEARIYRDVIEVKSTGSVYRALSSEAYTKEGLSPTLVVYDELHAAPNRDLYDVMALAMGARIDPLMVIVTTAGVRTDITGQDSIAYSLYQHGIRVASREVDDPSFYMAWWEPRKRDAPIDSPATWAEANPGLGDILDVADIRAAAQPGRTPESEFRIKRCNQWVTSVQAALPSGAFEDLAAKRTIAEGERIVLFLDGSFSGDSTGLVGCTMDGHLDVIGAWERPVDDPHWRVDIAAVEAAVISACGRYDVAEVACDPFRWQRSMQAMESAGVPIIEYNTAGPARMVPAWAKFYDAVTGAKLTHSGDPRLVRHIGNLALKVDRLGPRPVKEHRGSPRKIDLAICAVGAFDRATYYAGAPGPQVTEFAW